MADGNSKEFEDMEAELLKQAEDKSIDPIEAAAQGYGLYSFKLKQGIDQLSSKGTKRLFNALIDSKMSKKVYNLQGMEPMLLEMANFVMECKFLMEMETYNQNREEILKAADPNVELTEDQIEEFKQEQEK